MFDLIIKNGNIIDGTGNKPKKSDIGINADKIVTIGDLRDHEAKTIVDADGLCVSPGFIDTHSHLHQTLGDALHCTLQVS
jgi:N-acyl-D-aspartate/D-glutamate deacylase